MSNHIQEIVEKYVTQITEEVQEAIQADFAERLSALTGNFGVVRAPKVAKAAKSPRKKLDMTCHAQNCKQRSKGPRFKFLCEKHLAKASEAPVKAAKTPKAARKASHKKARAVEAPNETSDIQTDLDLE